MRQLFIALLLVVSGAVYSVSDRTTAVASHRGTFRVVTFNIFKGANVEKRYDLQRTIEAIARMDADLVGVQETLRNHPQFNCDDQPALIADGLRRLTGRRWAHTYSRAWITDNRECVARGRGDGVATEGLAFFTPGRIVATEQINLPESRVGGDDSRRRDARRAGDRHAPDGIPPQPVTPDPSDRGAAAVGGRATDRAS